jgi:hypothetical protein
MITRLWQRRVYRTSQKRTPKWTPEMEKQGKHGICGRVRCMIVNHAVVAIYLSVQKSWLLGGSRS